MTPKKTPAFRPVPGWEGLYSVSPCGQVHSEPRVTIRRNGTTYRTAARLLRPAGRWRCVTLTKPGARRVANVSALVREAWAE